MPTKTLTVVLQASITGLKAGLGAGSAQVKAFGDDVRRLGRSTTVNTDMIGKSMMVAGAAIVSGFVAASVAAVHFEQDLRNVTTISSYVADNFDQVSTRIMAMSNTLPQSSSELAKGLYDVASSGFAGKEGMVVLEQSAKAASAGLSTTAEAGSAITGVLNAYGLKASDAKDISDQMFQTVNLGVVTFGELSHEIGAVVGTAAAAKVPFKDVGSALATITLSGIPAAEATTALNRVLQNIISPSDKMRASLLSLGYESGQSALATDGLHNVMTKLVGSTHGNIEALGELFPDIRGLKGALSLTSAEGANWNRVLSGMEDATTGAGATQKALNQQSKALGFQLELLKNRVVNMGIAIGTALLPALKFLSNILGDVLGFFSDMPSEVQTVIGILAGSVAVLMLVGGAWLLLQSRVGRVKAIYNEMGPVSKDLTGKLGQQAANFLKVAAGAAIAAASLSQIGQGSQETAMGIGGMVAAGAAIGSAFPGYGTAIGAVAGATVGLTKALIVGSESVDVYRKKFAELATELDGLSQKNATQAFMKKLGFDDLLGLAHGGTEAVKALRNELEALGSKSPTQLKKVVAGLKEMKSASGEDTFGAKDVAALDKIVGKAEVSFAKLTKQKKQDAEADQLVAAGSRTAQGEMLKLGDTADATAPKLAALSDRQKDIQKGFVEALNPMDSWKNAVSIASGDAATSWFNFSKGSQGSLKDFTAQLAIQNQATADWQTNLLSIAVRGSQEFSDQLRGMGPEAAGLVGQIATASEPEFRAIEAQFGTSAALASDDATKAFDDGLAKAGQVAKSRSTDIGKQVAAGLDATMPGVVVKVQGYVGQINRALAAIRSAQVAAEVAGRIAALPEGGGIPGVDYRNGGIVRFADGGRYIRRYAEGHHAQIAPAGAWRVWAEPETGGEAYIPLGLAKRGRSMGILRSVASMFGARLMPNAVGGIYGGGAGGPGGLGSLLVNMNLVVHGNGDAQLMAAITSVLKQNNQQLARTLRRYR